jgi:hypothetical protein
LPQQALCEGLQENFSQLLSVCTEASKKVISFLHNKAAKNLKNMGAYTESTDLIFKTLKKTEAGSGPHITFLVRTSVLK